VPRRTRRRGIRGLAALTAAAALTGCGGREQADLLVTVRGDPMQNLDALSDPLLVVRSDAIQVGG
jgi:hypothetical protein